jgi:hypothetical protein
MTSLRTFQNEIDEIHTRETTKQRAQAAAEKEKENKDPHSKGKEVKGESQNDDDAQRGLTEIEDEIQVRV